MVEICLWLLVGHFISWWIPGIYLGIVILLSIAHTMMEG